MQDMQRTYSAEMLHPINRKMVGLVILISIYIYNVTGENNCYNSLSLNFQMIYFSLIILNPLTFTLSKMYLFYNYF